MKRRRIRILAVGLVLLLAAASLTGCKLHASSSKYTQTVSDSLETKLEAYRTDLLDSSDTMTSNDRIRKYLTDWADSKGINYFEDAGGNVVMTVDAGEGYENARPTILVCPYDAAEYQTYVEPMTMALYAIKNNQSTGKLTVIFTQEQGHQFVGAKKLSKGLFPDDARVIVLNGDQTGRLSVVSGGGASFRFTAPVEWTQPEYTKAYTITMSGLGSYQASTSLSEDNNPIIRMRKLLEDLSSSNIAYELASFQAGNDDDLSADSATITIVISADREEKFLEKMDDQTSRFNEDKSKQHPGAVFTYEACEMPERVMTTASRDRVVNFLYTLLSGTFQKDEEGAIALNNICFVSTSDDAVRIRSVGSSVNKKTLQNLIESEKTLCSLSDVQFEQIDSVPIWQGDEDADLSQRIAAAYQSYTGKSLTYSRGVTTTTAGFIHELNPNCEIVVMTVSSSVLKNCTGTLMEYLIQNVPDESA